MDTTALPTGLIERAIAGLEADHNVIGVILGGSFTRGEANHYSDVDFARIVREVEPGLERHRFHYDSGRLVCLSLHSFAVLQARLSIPSEAIWEVPTMRTVQIVLDREGQIAALKQAAIDFKWEPLQPAADAYASYLLYDNVELAHKLLGTLTTGNQDATMRATRMLVSGASEAIAVQRGLLIEAPNNFYNLLQVTVGREALWTYHYRAAQGYDQNTTHEQAVAALHLYLETVRLLAVAIQPEHRVVIEQALRLIAEKLLAEPT